MILGVLALGLDVRVRVPAASVTRRRRLFRSRRPCPRRSLNPPRPDLLLSVSMVSHLVDPDSLGKRDLVRPRLRNPGDAARGIDGCGTAPRAGSRKTRGDPDIGQRARPPWPVRYIFPRALAALAEFSALFKRAATSFQRRRLELVNLRLLPVRLRATPPSSCRSTSSKAMAANRRRRDPPRRRAIRVRRREVETSHLPLPRGDLRSLRISPSREVVVRAFVQLHQPSGDATPLLPPRRGAVETSPTSPNSARATRSGAPVLHPRVAEMFGELSDRADAVRGEVRELVRVRHVDALRTSTWRWQRVSRRRSSSAARCVRTRVLDGRDPRSSGPKRDACSDPDSNARSLARSSAACARASSAEASAATARSSATAHASVASTFPHRVATRPDVGQRGNADVLAQTPPTRGEACRVGRRRVKIADRWPSRRARWGRRSTVQLGVVSEKSSTSISPRSSRRGGSLTDSPWE